MSQVKSITLYIYLNLRLILYVISKKCWYIYRKYIHHLLLNWLVYGRLLIISSEQTPFFMKAKIYLL